MACIRIVSIVQSLIGDSRHVGSHGLRKQAHKLLSAMTLAADAELLELRITSFLTFGIWIYILCISSIVDSVARIGGPPDNLDQGFFS